MSRGSALQIYSPFTVFFSQISIAVFHLFDPEEEEEEREKKNKPGSNSREVSKAIGEPLRKGTPHLVPWSTNLLASANEKRKRGAWKPHTSALYNEV